MMTGDNIDNKSINLGADSEIGDGKSIVKSIMSRLGLRSRSKTELEMRCPEKCEDCRTELGIAEDAGRFKNAHCPSCPHSGVQDTVSSGSTARAKPAGLLPIIIESNTGFSRAILLSSLENDGRKATLTLPTCKSSFSDVYDTLESITNQQNAVDGAWFSVKRSGVDPGDQLSSIWIGQVTVPSERDTSRFNLPKDAGKDVSVNLVDINELSSTLSKTEMTGGTVDPALWSVTNFIESLPK